MALLSLVYTHYAYALFFSIHTVNASYTFYFYHASCVSTALYNDK